MQSAGCEAAANIVGPDRQGEDAQKMQAACFSSSWNPHCGRALFWDCWSGRCYSWLRLKDPASRNPGLDMCAAGGSGDAVALLPLPARRAVSMLHLGLQSRCRGDPARRHPVLLAASGRQRRRNAMVSGMPLPSISWPGRAMGPLCRWWRSLELARLATGLILTWRLYRRARNRHRGLGVGPCHPHQRSGARPPFFRLLHSSCPPIVRAWPRTKLDAVLAHEDSHIGRGDFFIQLLASLLSHDVLVQPLRLVAAGASVCAGRGRVRRSGHPAPRRSRHLCRNPGGGFAAAPAACPSRWRWPKVPTSAGGWIASWAPGSSAWAGWPDSSRAAAILPAALAVAGAHAAVPPAASSLPRYMPLAISMPVMAEAAPDTVAAAGPAPNQGRGRPSHRTDKPARSPTPRYDPRALLNAPDVAVIPALLPLTDDRRRKNSENAAFILGGSVYVPGN